MPLTKYRTLGRSGLVVSPLALGTMTFGTARWGLDEAGSAAVFNAYLDLGGNFVDTADVYSAGRSEEMLGKFVAEGKLREKVVIATKAGFAAGQGVHTGGNGAKHIHAALEGSLRRLRTDYVDLFWIHVWDSVTPAEELLETMNALVRPGKIRYWGMSNAPAWYVSKLATLAALRGMSGPIALQYFYALVNRDIEDEQVPLGSRLKGSPYACLKGSNGYPQQLARMLNLSLEDMTCSGATTTQVFHGGQYFQRPQIGALSENTQLVTLTTGGNDVSYVGDLILLAARSRGGAIGWLLRLWPEKLKPAEDRAFPRLHSELLATLSEIRRRAPQARIIVVTYPAILPPSGTCPRLGISANDAIIMRHVGDTLAELTRTSAQEAAVRVVDMAKLSQGHDACSSSPWVNGAAPPQGAKFHPTLAGASATTVEIRNALIAYR